MNASGPQRRARLIVTRVASRVAIGVLGLVQATTFEGVAHAADDTNKTAAGGAATATAETLFHQGRSLMQAGRFEQACMKLAQSQKLDPGAGTALNLAECYEHQGKVASAWRTYQETEALARQNGQQERAMHANARTAVLAPVLPTLTIKVGSLDKASAVGEPLIVIRHNGAIVPRSAWHTAMPVDPGEQIVEVRNPRSERPWRDVVNVNLGGHVTLEVPALPSTFNSGGGTTPTTATTAAMMTTTRVLPWALIATGGALVASGLVFGIVARDKNNEAREGERHCSSTDCDPRGFELLGQASDFATVSTILFLAGGATLATGGFLLAFPVFQGGRGAEADKQKKTAPSAPRLAILPSGVTFRGSF